MVRDLSPQPQTSSGLTAQETETFDILRQPTADFNRSLSSRLFPALGARRNELNEIPDRDDRTNPQELLGGWELATQPLDDVQDRVIEVLVHHAVNVPDVIRGPDGESGDRVR